MAKMGRPAIEISFKELKKLCEMQATLEECAGFFDCSEDTIKRKIKEKYDMTFASFFKKHSAGGRASLRRVQYKKALEGNTTMMIWLGKQHLGQTDKVESTVDIKNRSFDLNFYDHTEGSGENKT